MEEAQCAEVHLCAVFSVQLQSRRRFGRTLT
jgi:hypothetical protein